jgi:hypothetical protein
MDDQGIEAWAPLGFIDPRDGPRIRRVGGEAVNRLGRNRDRFAGQDQPSGFGDGFVCERKDARLHADAATGFPPLQEY